MFFPQGRGFQFVIVVITTWLITEGRHGEILVMSARYVENGLNAFAFILPTYCNILTDKLAISLSGFHSMHTGVAFHAAGV